MSHPSIKNCFVIIGYGEKVDLATQRRLNLDRVFENIIKPAFESFNDPKFNCFRACDENYGGVIDAQMYKWILEADFVVADISTLNPNAIYELGVRHALRPYSTLVIAEDGIKEFPFDVSHVKIEKYRHLGEDIGVAEAKRFVKVLTEKIGSMLQHQTCDSPIYTYIQKLKPPFLEEAAAAENQKSLVETRRVNDITQTDNRSDVNLVSLTELLKNAGREINANNFSKSLVLLKEAENRDDANVSIKQKIIFATYKSEEPNRQEAFQKACQLLKLNFDLTSTTDIRTLELGGIINKQLAELDYDQHKQDNAIRYAESAIEAYERAFVLSNSPFIGANYAQTLMLRAALEDRIKNKYTYFLRSCIIWQKVQSMAYASLGGKEMPVTKKTQNVYKSYLRATLVLTNGRKSERLESIKTELLSLMSETQKTKFLDRLNKTVKYAKLVRAELKKHPGFDLFVQSSLIEMR